MRTATPVLLLCLLTACGSDESAEQDLKATAYQHMDAINQGDIPRLRQHMSLRCVAERTDQELGEVVDLIHTMYGEITLINVKVTDMNKDETRARVKGTTGIHALDTGPGAWWVYESNSWRADDC